jgi:hypothetical protein
MAFDEVGQADTQARKVEICTRAYKPADRAGRLPGRGHHLRPEHLCRGHRHRGAQQLRGRLHRGHPRHQADPAPCAGLRRRVQRVVLVPRQQPGARGDPRGVPVPRHQGGHGHGHRQRRPAGHLRRPARGAARGGRGRHPQPPRRRHRAPAGHRPEVQGRRRGAPRSPRTWSGAAGRSKSAGARAGQGHHRLHRRGHRGRPAAPRRRWRSSKAR